jgi:TolB-like protein
VSVGTRALDLLVLLVERQGNVVTRDEAMAAVWPDTVVEEANLAVQISALRRALDPAEVETSCIQTVPGRGYRFVTPITRHVASAWASSSIARRDDALDGGAAASRASGCAWTVHDRAPPRPAAFSPQDRRQSVIVLPFENSSGESAQDGLAAGIARDIADIIAKFPDLPLVPAATAAAYRGQPLDLRVIGRAHDVHFALTGHARRQDGRLVVAATVYDVVDARQVWSRRFDRPDSPDELNGVVQSIYQSFWQATVDAETARALRERPDDLDKRDLLLAALTTPLQQFTKANILAKRALAEKALALDPHFFDAHERLARAGAHLVLFGYSADPEADLAVAAEAAGRMLLTDPNALYALRAKSFVLRAQGQWEEAAAVLRRVIALQPLEGNRRSEYGMALMALGQHEEALENFLAAKRLAGGSDPIFMIDADIAMGLLACNRYPEAIAQARLAISEFPPETGRVGEGPWLALIASECLNGQDSEARESLRRFLSTPRILRSTGEVKKLAWLAANPKLIEGLRRAGMPEA